MGEEHHEVRSVALLYRRAVGRGPVEGVFDADDAQRVFPGGQGEDGIFEQRDAARAQDVADEGGAAFVVVVAQDGGYAPRRRHGGERVEEFLHISAALLVVPAEEEHVGPEMAEHAAERGDVPLAELAGVVRVGNEGHAEAVEGGRHVGMGHGVGDDPCNPAVAEGQAGALALDGLGENGCPGQGGEQQDAEFPEHGCGKWFRQK